jgi:hypothetical protein
MLTHDDKRLAVTDYFLNEDDFGKIHFEGDHHFHAIKVFKLLGSGSGELGAV